MVISSTSAPVAATEDWLNTLTADAPVFDQSGAPTQAARHAIAEATNRPNQAMQRTASRASTDASSACLPHFSCVFGCSGLAVADLVSRYTVSMFAVA